MGRKGKPKGLLGAAIAAFVAGLHWMVLGAALLGVYTDPPECNGALQLGTHFVH